MNSTAGMAMNFIEEIKRNLESNIPTSSSMVSEVIRIIYDQSSSAADLAKVIENDPPLSADVLKVANSAYYGASSKIDSIRRAVVILGFDTIKEMASNVTTVHYFFSHQDKSGLDRPGLWLHSVGTAKASQLLAERLNYCRPDLAYSVGLLHDIGKILLAMTYPERYTEAVQVAKKKKTRIILAERKALNTDHTMIGKILCDMWHLPEELSAALFYHHDPMMTPHGSQKIARIVNIGDYLCRRAEIGNPGDDLVPEPSSGVIGTVAKKRSKALKKLDEIYEEFLEMKEGIEEFFSGLK